MIPYHKMYSTGKEIEYMNDCLRHGQPGGDGIYTKLVGEFLQTYPDLSEEDTYFICRQLAEILEGL